MTVKLNTEQLTLNTAVCSRFMQTTVENDVIVPDIKPDIVKILQASSEVAITRKEVQTDKIFVQGIVRINVLYTPDNGIDGSIKAISSTHEFNHSADIPGAANGMELIVDAQSDPAEYTLVNSRKLKLRTRISLSARLLSGSEISFATGVDEDCSVEAKCKAMKLYNPCISTARDIIVRERLEVPEGKPSICEVLKISAKPCSTELKALDRNATISGELKICTLYCGEGDNARPEVMEHTLPFNEAVEVDNLCEGMTTEVDFCLKNLYCEVCRDSDGDRRLLSIEATIEAQLRGFEVLEYSVVEDAYSPLYPIELKRNMCHIEQLVASCVNQTTVKEPIAIPDYLPDIHCLCECTATPTIESVTVDSGEATVSGFIQCNILYLSDDPGTPACGFAHLLPFSQSFNVPGATQTSVCEASAEPEHISCTISSARGIEARAIVSVSIRVIEPTAVELVSEIVCDEAAPLPKTPSMSVYFVQKGDTLWSIAKKYRISPDRILSANPTAENLTPGKCIYIFR